MNRLLFRLRNLLCALLTGFGLLSVSCSKTKYTWSSEDEYFKVPIWGQHVKKFKKLKYPVNTVTLFIGDSMTEGYDLDRFLQQGNLVNMGISGDFTSGVLRRLDYVERLQPKKIFVMIGINDILNAIPQARIKSQYVEIISSLQLLCPSSIIYVQSNLPTANMGGSPAGNATIVSKVEDLNLFLSQECEMRKVNFIQLYPHFLSSEGVLISTLTYDGLHLSEEGYKVWTEQIKQLVKE